ncbi:MAG TPA: hypothetical protein VJA21_23525 [Verrucomicrobiae bacterium]
MRLDQVDIGDLIAVTDNHHPPMEEESVTETVEVGQGRRKAQFLQTAQNCFG